jgi:hypothetical protein
LTPDEGTGPRSVAAFSPANESSVALGWLVLSKGADNENCLTPLTETSAVNLRREQPMEGAWQLAVPTICDSKTSREEFTAVDHVFALCEGSPETVAADPNCFSVQFGFVS